MSVSIVILRAMEIAPLAAEAEGSGERAFSGQAARTVARSLALRAAVPVFARNAKGAARSKLEAKLDCFSDLLFQPLIQP